MDKVVLMEIFCFDTIYVETFIFYYFLMTFI